MSNPRPRYPFSPADAEALRSGPELDALRVLQARIGTAIAMNESPSRTPRFAVLFRRILARIAALEASQ